MKYLCRKERIINCTASRDRTITVELGAEHRRRRQAGNRGAVALNWE